MTAVFHARPYGRFIEIQSNLWRNKLHRTNQSYIFLEAALAIQVIEEHQSNLDEKDHLSILKDDFSATTDPTIFLLIAPVLLDQLNKTF